MDELDESMPIGTSAPAVLAPPPPPRSESSAPSSVRRLAYPEARRAGHVDDYHGVKVADPYRWLEDLDSRRDARLGRGREQGHRSPTSTRIPARDAHPHAPDRAVELREVRRPARRRAAATSSPRTTACRTRASSTRLDSLDGEPRVLLDPNTLVRRTAPSPSPACRVSDDGKHLAYGLASRRLRLAGVARARRRDRPRPRPTSCKWIKFSSAAWTNDGKGFFYSRFDEPEAGRAARAGRTTTRSSTTTASARRRPTTCWSTSGPTTRTGASTAERHRRRPLPRHRPSGKGTDDREPRLLPATSDEPRRRRRHRRADRRLRRRVHASSATTARSSASRPTCDAPRGRVIAIDIAQARRARTGSEMHPAGRGDPRRRSRLVGNRFVATYLKDAHSQVQRLRPGRQARARGRAARPRHGGRLRAASARDTRDVLLLHQLHHAADHLPLRPGHRQEHASSAGRRSQFNPDDYEIKQVFYTSKDGTQVPMFITAQEGAEARRRRTRRCSTATAASTSR